MENNDFLNKKNIVLMFPGQGSQYKDMGMDIIEDDKNLISYFEFASKKLSENLIDIIKGNPNIDDLNKTFFSQTAIFTLSCAIKEYIFKNTSLNEKKIMCCIGHSLGDYSALSSCGCFSFQDGLDLVMNRATMMEKINEDKEGMMAAIIGIGIQELEEFIKEYGKNVYIANYNDYSQIVVTGLKKDVDDFLGFLKSRNNAKAIPIKVKTTSHCPIMLPVSQELRKYIGDMQINKGDIAFFSASEKSFCSYEQITQVLAEQLLKTINWLESIEILLEKGADVFIEIGPGKVLSGLVKRIASKKGKEVKIFNTDNLEQISFLKKFLNEGN